MRTFRVKNFEKFQHYKDRSPPWIKLYNELLEDYEFGQMPDASKWHLIAIWLLASRSGNEIPFDPAWVSRRINAATEVDLSELERLGFIIQSQSVNGHDSAMLADRSQTARPERETEGEEERDKRSGKKGSKEGTDSEIRETGWADEVGAF